MLKRTLLLVVLLTLAGCASTLQPAPPAPPRVADLLHDTAFGTPTAVHGAADVFALNAAMRDYLHTTAAPALRHSGPLEGLIQALYTKSQLQLAYDADRTRTAAEAFDARAGNCLSLVLMTAAFAKELGLRVRYQVVESPAVWDRAGNLVLNIGHVNVSIGQPLQMVRMVGTGAQWLTVDFMPVPENNRMRVHPVEEERLLAMYLNNRAAEALAGGDVEAAYWWARGAVLQDSAFANGYNTLGVVYRRRGELQWAESALRQVLAMEPDNPQALGNLAQLMHTLGREPEAQALFAQLQRVQPNPPFLAYEQGMQALRAGDYTQARKLLEADLPRVNGHHEVHFGLALAYWHLGDNAAAARHLQLARDNSMTRQQHALYAAKLAHLKAAPTP